MTSDPNPPPPSWIAPSLDRGQGEIARGEAEPVGPVLERIRASIARMQARPPGRRKA